MRLSRTLSLAVATFSLSVAGCSSLGGLESAPYASARSTDESKAMDFASEADVQAALKRGLTRSQILMRSGVDLLRKGELDKAQAVFNTALKFDFNNAQLHLLNALTYHEGYLQGRTENLSLAAAGYRTALLQDPSLEGVANLQLGRLFLDARDPAAATQAYAMAVAANRDSADALYGLAQASALEGDLPTSYWAVRQLERSKWNSPLLVRMKAIHAALAHQPDAARAFTAAYAKSAGDGADTRYLNRRVSQLLAAGTFPAEAGVRRDSGRNDMPDRLAQNGSPPPLFGPGAAPAADAAKSEPADIRKWFRCDTGPGIPSQNAGALQANDENITNPPLPAPCPGETPKIAMIEVSLIGTEETNGRSFGINLLDGLTAIFTLQRDRAYTSTTNEHTESITNRLVIANSADGTLRYSLNIANAAYTRSEVIARPTLAAIDRVPAVFFSGATITLGVAGVGGGSSTIVDKPIGISLSVTPTFIDAENLLVSMRATRSNIAPGLVSASSSVLLQVTRNAINASSKLRFGETFLVSGLTLRQDTVSRSGTPVLQDIPVLQYLFNRTQRTDVTAHLLTMITIRRPPDAEAEAGRTQGAPGVSPHRLSNAVSEFVRLQTTQPATDVILESFKADFPRYRQLRDRDVMAESARPRIRLEKTLDDIKDLIYY